MRRAIGGTKPSRFRRSHGILALAGALFALPASAGFFPMYASWPQSSGPGSAIFLTYSYSNLLAGGMLAGSGGGPLPEDLMRSAFEAALADYAAVLPIHFIEIADAGPLPETGEYDPQGLADIRIGQVPHIVDANAYAYFPEIGSGLAGDVVFNAERSGLGWSPVLYYAVAQHELGHSLGMGHYVDGEPEMLLRPLAQEAPYAGPIIPLAPLMLEALQAVYGEGTGSVSPLPEPGLAAQLGVGLLAIGFAQRRTWRRRAAVRGPSFPRRLRRIGSVGFLACLALASLSAPASAVSVLFDYRFDSQGFFDPTTDQGLAARTALEQAGQIGSLLQDELAAIAPAAGESWTTRSFLNPGGSGFVSVADLVVPEDSIVVFVGGRSLGGALGFASGPDVGSVTGGVEFIDIVLGRGQAGALDPIATDVGPWGGSITFNASVPWHFDTVTGPGSTTQDFLTTATHELLHILGIGTAASWEAQIESGHFVGEGASALFGGPVPVDPGAGHWAEGVMSAVMGLPQETLMDPTTPRGVRELVTDLDLAGLQDLGWIVVVPEPSSALLIGLGLMALARRKESI